MMEDVGGMKKSACAAAATFHIAATVAIYFASAVVPLTRLFPDTVKFQKQIVISAGALRQSGVGPWFFSLLPFHVKLHAFCFGLFGRGTSFSVLWCEPLNLPCYVGILCLVFTMSRWLFGARTALATVVVIGVWPSFLAHTTQPLKDSLFIALGLLFLALSSMWLVKEYSWRRALLVAVGGSITEFLLWVVKSDMWELMIGAGFLSFVLLLVKMIRAGKFMRANVLGLAVLIVMSVVIPRGALLLYRPAVRWAEARGVSSLYKEPPGPADVLPQTLAVTPRSILASRISMLRHRFNLSYDGAGSNIDTDVEFHSTSEIIRYLPRAALIGLFAPFPDMWFETGSQNGKLGRMIGGAETLMLYFFEAMAVIGLWQHRRELLAWWLALVALSGCIALGLVVTNVGAVYRMRYIFVMLIVIIGIEGIRQTLSYFPHIKNRFSPRLQQA
jgi:hypothetical protein